VVCERRSLTKHSFESCSHAQSWQTDTGTSVLSAFVRDFKRVAARLNKIYYFWSQFQIFLCAAERNAVNLSCSWQIPKRFRCAAEQVAFVGKFLELRRKALYFVQPRSEELWNCEQKQLELTAVCSALQPKI
jgi:hypothetical protein